MDSNCLMSKITPKRAGYCSICDVLLFTVKKTWTDEARKGQPREFGPMLSGVKRAIVVLLDGTHTHFSLCSSCNMTTEALQFVWKRTLMTTRLEASPEWRKANGLRQYKHAQLVGALKNLEKFMQNMPLGVLCTQTYAEMNDG